LEEFEIRSYESALAPIKTVRSSSKFVAVMTECSHGGCREVHVQEKDRVVDQATAVAGAATVAMGAFLPKANKVGATIKPRIRTPNWWI
jgi:hypothetical protein